MNKLFQWLVNIGSAIMGILAIIFMVKNSDKDNDKPLEVLIENNKKAEIEVKRKIDILTKDKTSNKKEIEILKKELEETQKKINDLEKQKKPVTAEEAYDFLKEFANND